MSDEIVDYILAREENLNIAAAVVDAWPAVRRRAARDFIARLESRLKPQLPDWKFERANEPFDDSWAGFYVFKPKWEGFYSLTVQWAAYGADGRFGVARDSDDEEKLPHCPGLLEVVQQRFAGAKANKWWEARITPRDLGPDWTTPAAIWRLARDERLSSEMADDLLELAQLVGPILEHVIEQRATRT